MLQSRYQSPFIVSLLLHIVMLGVLVVSFEFRSQTPVLENADKNSEIINAVVLDATKVQMPDPAPVPPKVKPQPVKKVLPPQPAAVQPVQKVEPEVKKVIPKPVPQVQPKAIAIPDKRKPIQKDLIQKQLLAELAQVKQLKKKKHSELEKAFEKELKAQSAKSLEQQLLSEQTRAASAAQAQKMRGIVDKYKALILQAIAQHWLVPAGIDKTLSTELLIRVAPGGAVLDVQVTKSSGIEALDASARTAVLKASPLPVPTDTDEFDPFRQFTLKTKPENVIARDSDLSLAN